MFIRVVDIIANVEYSTQQLDIKTAVKQRRETSTIQCKPSPIRMFSGKAKASLRNLQKFKGTLRLPQKLDDLPSRFYTLPKIPRPDISLLPNVSAMR